MIAAAAVIEAGAVVTPGEMQWLKGITVCSEIFCHALYWFEKLLYRCVLFVKILWCGQFFFCILYSSKIVKEYINSISTDMKQPARYYVEKKNKHESNTSIGVKKMGKYTCTWLYIHTILSERCSRNWQLWLYVKRDS